MKLINYLEQLENIAKLLSTLSSVSTIIRSILREKYNYLVADLSNLSMLFLSKVSVFQVHIEKIIPVMKDQQSVQSEFLPVNIPRIHLGQYQIIFLFPI